MLLDHRHDVASELQADWRAEAHHSRMAGAKRSAAADSHRLDLGRLRRSASSFMQAHHLHAPGGLHLSSRH